MAELIDVFNAMIKRGDWSAITEDDKNKNFFTINRYFSKKYLEQAQLLNLKNIDKVGGMELWYQFMKNEPYPSYFWSKSEKNDKPILAPKDYKMLLVSLKIKPDDLDYLIEKHFDFIKEELSFLVKLYKQ
jgi:hypothetical protein